MDGANSTEFDPETPFPVIDLLPEQKEVRDLGGTMRLGADPVKLHEGTRAREIYGEPVIYERHRHRYEVNNHLRKRLEHAGLVCSGTSPDDRLVEAIELPDHPVLRRLPVPPRVQVAATASAAAVPGLRRRSRRACRWAGDRSARGRALGAARLIELSHLSLVEYFIRLCEIESPSRNERAIADFLTEDLRSLGLEVEEDDTGAETGSNAGNLLARVPREGGVTPRQTGRPPRRCCSARTWTRSR